MERRVAHGTGPSRHRTREVDEPLDSSASSQSGPLSPPESLSGDSYSTSSSSSAYMPAPWSYPQVVGADSENAEQGHSSDRYADREMDLPPLQEQQRRAQRGMGSASRWSSRARSPSGQPPAFSGTELSSPTEPTQHYHHHRHRRHHSRHREAKVRNTPSPDRDLWYGDDLAQQMYSPASAEEREAALSQSSASSDLASDNAYADELRQTENADVPRERGSRRERPPPLRPQPRQRDASPSSVEEQSSLDSDSAADGADQNAARVEPRVKKSSSRRPAPESDGRPSPNATRSQIAALPSGLCPVADPFVFTESLLLNYEERVSDLWEPPGCGITCMTQPAACLLGSCCCCSVPCFLVQERRMLLFEKTRSRYICCQGAMPCCWPPPSVRPELYFTYIAPSEREQCEDDTRRQRRLARHIDPDGSHAAGDGFASSEKYVRADARGHTARRPIVAVNGISSITSLTSASNALPQFGCYNNVRHAKSAAFVKPPTPPPDDEPHTPTWTCGCDCCRLSSTAGTCKCDYVSRDCLCCRHSTACCMSAGCPFCCLAMEVCCCMPCSLLGNRLLIRRHYGLAPDPLLDRNLGSMYSCCLSCLTAQTPAHLRHKYLHRPLTTLAPTCWYTFARSFAACLAATCCLWPCQCVAIAQQRDLVERYGYPITSTFRPSDVSGMA